MWSTIRQAASLLGLAACLASCAGGGSPGPFEPDTSRTSPQPTWVDEPPESCATGSSGPTLNPRNAIRYARANAIKALGAGSLPVEVNTITGTGSDGDFELTTQSISGMLADARIVAIWADTSTRGTLRSRVRQVHALACWPGASLRDVPRPDYPEWLLEPPSKGGRICATGIAGPTWKPEDQPVSALRDARLALAIALESRIEERIVDRGQGAARTAGSIDPSAAALARAATVQALSRDWLDVHGTGPIGLPGILYGLACLDE